MKRVCIVDQGEIYGGAEYFALDLIRAMKDQYELFLCQSTNVDERYKNTLKELGDFPTCTVYFPSLRPFSLKTLGIFLLAVWKFSRFVKKNNIQYIYSNTVRAHLLTSMVSLINRVPLLWMMHDLTFPSTLLSRLWKIPTRIAGVSTVVLEYIRQHTPKEVEKKLMIIPNGVWTDIPFFPTREVLDLPSGKQFIFDSQKKYVAIIGRIDLWKGQDIFLQAIDILYKEGKIPMDMEFLVVGDVTATSEERIVYGEELQRFTKDHNLSSVVHFLGHQTLDNVLPKLFMLVQASTSPEPFGRTIIEAFHAGVPVIASSLGAAKELIRYGKTGLHFESGNPHDLAKKILFLTEDKNLYNTVVFEARREVEQKYSMKRVQETFNEIFSS